MIIIQPYGWQPLTRPYLIKEATIVKGVEEGDWTVDMEGGDQIEGETKCCKKIAVPFSFYFLFFLSFLGAKRKLNK